MHQEWLSSGAFATGIAGIFGPLWHRPDKLGYYFGQIDSDNSVAIKEILKWKGDSDIAALEKRTVVEQHADNADRSLHLNVYSKFPLTNKDSDVPKSDEQRPSFEVHCGGRMGIMAGSMHKKGYPMMLLNQGADDVTTEPMTLEDDQLEQYLDSICIRYGLNPYLSTGNGQQKHSGGVIGYSNNKDSLQRNDGISLDEDLVQMLKQGVGHYDENIAILNGTRHNKMLKIANFILFRYSDDRDKLTELKDWFILINEHCCKPSPLSNEERDEIWSDAVEYVSRKKAEESNRILTVSEAIREKTGKGKTVRGTVVSISSPMKVTLHREYRCLNCQRVNPSVKLTSGPVLYPALQLKSPSKCVNCEEEHFEIDDDSTEMDDAKIITLQNIDLINGDQIDETLEVLLMGDNTKYTRAGEVVTIQGTLYYGVSNIGTPGKNKKTVALMSSKFVTYEDRQNFTITDRDMNSFYRFVLLDENTVIDRLVSMTAPNVIGQYDWKLGGLRSIVGGRDTNKRGRIHSLYAGDKGLAKTTFIYELTRMQPNSRFITAPSASSRSALGIVDSNGDIKTLIYGPIPLSSGAMVGIDELPTWTYDEQGSLLSVMEHGEFYLLKYGKNRPIKAQTTILATANPQDIRYANRTTLRKDEIPLLSPLLDRFDQIFVTLDNRTEIEDRIYADAKFTYSTQRRAHNYNFITKFLLFAKTLQPVFMPQAASMLKEFWIGLRAKKLAGNRTLESIFRNAEAMAKLRLKTVIDTAIAAETMESFRRMLEQQGEFIKATEDPHVVFIRAADEIVENTQAPIAFDEITNQVCREYQHIDAWLCGGRRNSLNVENNRAYRDLRTRFIQHVELPTTKIAIVKFKPLVVVWQTAKAPNQTIATPTTSAPASDTTDTTDTTDIKKIPQNSNQVQENGLKVDTSSKTDIEIQREPNGGVLPRGHKNSESPDLDNKPISIEKEEGVVSDMSDMSVAAAMTAVETNSDKPTYEYLKEVDAYRCNWCKCIYYANTKDTNVAHPCNFRGRPAAGA